MPRSPSETPLSLRTPYGLAVSSQFAGGFAVCLLAGKLDKSWGCSSAGRAPRSQRGGQRFDPAQLHQSLHLAAQVVVFDLSSLILWGHTHSTAYFEGRNKSCP